MNKKAQQEQFVYILAFIIFAIILLVFIYFYRQNREVNNLNNITLNISNLTYPNAVLTPGDVLSTNVTIICVSGYSATVRDVSESDKKAVFARYNITYPEKLLGIWEVDHFVPLSLGGSNSLENLWPEPAEPRPGFYEKDKVENYLHDQVCKHGMNISLAQEQIRTDWLAIYNQCCKEG